MLILNTKMTQERDDALHKYFVDLQKKYIGPNPAYVPVEFLIRLAYDLCDDIPLGYNTSHRLAAWIFNLRPSSMLDEPEELEAFLKNTPQIDDDSENDQSNDEYKAIHDILIDFASLVECAGGVMNLTDEDIDKFVEKLKPVDPDETI